MLNRTDPVGILGAMPEEVELLRGALADPQARRLAGVEFYTGGFAGRQVTVCCAGMGKVNAAVAAQLLITVFGARALLFSGIAGNMTTRVSVGDMVIGNELVYHDAELAMIAQSYPNLTAYPANPALVAAAEAACRSEQVRYTVGRIATGDQFVGDSETKERIRAACDPACVEMEGAALAQVAAKNDLPFVVLRTMSDDCDEAAREKLVVQQFDISGYCRTASRVTLKILENIAAENGG